MDDTEDLVSVCKLFCNPSGSYTTEFIGINKDNHDIYLRFMPIGFRGRGMRTKPILVALNKKDTR